LIKKLRREHNDKSKFDKLNKLSGDDLRLEIAKPFLPKRVLKMTKKNQIK
jgi:hypothetical protein